MTDRERRRENAAVSACLLHIYHTQMINTVKCKSLCTTTIILCVFISNDEIIASFVKCVGLFLFLLCKTKENARYFHFISYRDDSKTAYTANTGRNKIVSKLNALDCLS